MMWKKVCLLTMLMATVLSVPNGYGQDKDSDCSNYQKALMSSLYPTIDEAVAEHYGTMLPYSLIEMNVNQKQKEAFFIVKVKLQIEEGDQVYFDEIELEIGANQVQVINYNTVH